MSSSSSSGSVSSLPPLSTTYSDYSGTYTSDSSSLPRHRRERARGGKARIAIDIGWKNIKYSVPRKGRDPLHILKGITGTTSNGTMTALLGASGAGKTTLLNLLAGRLPPGGEIGGEVYLNGEPSDPRKFRSICSMVTQDDILPDALSPRELLEYTARLRIPGASAKERSDIVMDTLGVLNLTHRADTIVGTPGLVRGLSGGERKRVNVANSLVADPPMLLLDEPTSGLDSESSLDLCVLLRKIVDERGTTILATLHQPAFEALELFDKVIVMAEGKVAYEGAPDQMREYFEELGYPVPEYINPADHVLKLVTPTSKLEDDSEGSRGTTEEDYYLDDDLDSYYYDGDDSVYTESFADDGGGKNSSNNNNNKVDWKKFPGQKRVMELLRSYESLDPRDPSRTKLPPVAAPKGSGAVSPMQQVAVVASRTLRTNLRSRILTQVRLIEAILVGLLGGFVFYRFERDQTGASSVQGALFIIIVQVMISSLVGVLYIVPGELPLYFRERSDGAYGTFTYTLGKFLGEVPGNLIFPFIFVVLAYFLTGLRDDDGGGTFFMFALTMFLLSLNGAAIGTLVSSATGDVGLSLQVAPATIPIMLLFCGFLRNLRTMTKALSWIRFINPLYYGYKEGFLGELSTAKFYCTPAQLDPQGRCAITSGLQIIKLRDINLDFTSRWGAMGVLVLLFLFFRSMGGMVLYLKTRKRIANA